MTEAETRQRAVALFGGEDAASKAFAHEWQQLSIASARMELAHEGKYFWNGDNALKYSLMQAQLAEASEEDAAEIKFELDEILKRDDAAYRRFQLVTYGDDDTVITADVDSDGISQGMTYEEVN